jgi:hypothetical protein
MVSFPLITNKQVGTYGLLGVTHCLPLTRGLCRHRLDVGSAVILCPCVLFSYMLKVAGIIFNVFPLKERIHTERSQKVGGQFHGRGYGAGLWLPCDDSAPSRCEGPLARANRPCPFYTLPVGHRISLDIAIMTVRIRERQGRFKCRPASHGRKLCARSGHLS